MFLCNLICVATCPVIPVTVEINWQVINNFYKVIESISACKEKNYIGHIMSKVTLIVSEVIALSIKFK